MVGRLVEQQQVGALPDQHRQHQARLLAARERADFLIDHVADEAEAPEEVAQLLLARLRADLPGQADHVRQRPLLGPQHIHFLLREVADRQALALLDPARQARERPGQRLDQRRLALAVGAQDADALARQHRFRHAAHDRRLAVADLDRIHHQHGVGQAQRFAEGELEVGGGQHRRELLHAGQRLDPALRLLGLGRLGLEAVDEALQLRHLLLLAAVGGLLLQHALGAHRLEGGVVAAIAGHPGLVQVQRDPGHRVEELAVVADDQHRALEAQEPGLQPDQRVQVQVVGGLVEQQQVARAHQRARELQPHAPAAREAVDRQIQLADPEAQAEQQRLRTRAGVEGAGFGQARMGLADGVAVAAGLGLGQRGARGHQRRVALEHELGRAGLGLGHVLRDLGDAPARRHLDVAGVRVQPVGQQREQRGLARAVAPDQRGLLAGLERERGVVEHELRAATQRDVLELEHGKVGFSADRRRASAPRACRPDR